MNPVILKRSSGPFVRSRQWAGVVLLGVGGALFALPGLAQVSSASLDAQTGVSLALSRGSMTYQSIERSSSGFITNQENGKLPTVAAALRWQGEQWFAQARYAIARHDVDYQGYTQLLIPLTTTSKLDIRQLNVQGGYEVRVANHTAAQWRVGLERLHIDRLIQPALGSLPLQEVMTSDRLMLGMGLRHTWPDVGFGGRRQPVSVQANVDALRSFRQDLDVGTFGLYDNVRLQPARGTDWRWQLAAQWQVLPQLEIGLGYVQERFAPGVSPVGIFQRNGTPVTGVRYPGSQQQLQTVDVSLRYRF